MCVRIYIYIYIYIYALYIYIYIYIHTYTHTQLCVTVYVCFLLNMFMFLDQVEDNSIVHGPYSKQTVTTTRVAVACKPRHRVTASHPAKLSGHELLSAIRKPPPLRMGGLQIRLEGSLVFCCWGGSCIKEA